MPTDASVLTATRRLLEATSYATGEELFRNLAAATAEVLGMRWALVGQVVAGDRLATRALWDTDRFVANITYDLDGTPCQHVLDEGTCQYTSDVTRRFPRDPMLAELGIESYAGLHLRGRGREALGVLAAFHDRPLEPNAELTTILQLFASRAAVELEREQAEQKLRDGEARYRQIVTTCGEGVWTIDAAANTTFVNHQMATMLGYQPEEMLGQSMYRFMDDDARATAARNFARRASGVGERHDFRFQRKDGREVWTTLAATPMYDDRGEFAGALALVTDETERRALDRKLQQIQRLDSLGALAGGVAHDFNNLLAGIIGNLDAVRPAVVAGSPMHHAFEDVTTAAYRAADLVRQLLTFAGRSRCVLGPVDLNALVLETQQLLHAAISRQATLRLDLADRLPAVVADATQLGQVVMNLLTNASDALGDRGGVITLASRVIRADRALLDTTYVDEHLPEGDYVALEVTDTGAGMDAATMAHIFDPFFTTKTTGHGLGLAAVLGILRSHRGAIRLVSEPGHGASFTVLLPVAPDATVTAPAPTPESATSERAPAPAHARGKVLIVDDEPGVSGAARRVLEAAGYAVIVAGDGQAGVAALAEHADVQVVLLDLTLPRLSGADAFRAMRRLRPDVPVVLSSGYDRDDAAGLIGADVAGFLPKPWSIEQLTAAVARAADGRGQPDEAPSAAGGA